jgi:hypothetical protein
LDALTKIRKKRREMDAKAAVTRVSTVIRVKCVIHAISVHRALRHPLLNPERKINRQRAKGKNQK